MVGEQTALGKKSLQRGLWLRRGRGPSSHGRVGFPGAGVPALVDALVPQVRGPCSAGCSGSPGGGPPYLQWWARSGLIQQHLGHL